MRDLNKDKAIEAVEMAGKEAQGQDVHDLEPQQEYEEE